MTYINDSEIEIQGMILDDETISSSDYLLGADIEIPRNNNTKRFFYDQSARKGPAPYNDTRWSCGLFGNMGVISDLTGYEFTEKDILEIQKSAVDNYGLKVPGGMTMSNAADCLRNWWNTKFPKKKLVSFRLEVGDGQFHEALKKRHSLSVGYKTSREYYNDSQDDGEISRDDFPKGGGHLVRVNMGENSLYISDNYEGRKPYNSYKNAFLLDLKKNGVFFYSAYLFLYEKPDIDDPIRDGIGIEEAKIAYDLGIFNGKDPHASVSRQEAATMIVRAVKLAVSNPNVFKK